MDFSWVAFALVAAFSLATSDAFAKKALAAHNEYLIAWLRLVVALPGLLAVLLFIPAPPLGRDYYIAGALSMPFEIAAMVLYIKALKVSPLSLTLPFLSLTPVFLIIVPSLLLGEQVSVQGGIGVLLVAAGGYLLNLKEFRKGVFEPFRAVGRERGSVYMILVALIFSITSTLGKRAIEASSPLFFASTYYIVLVVLFAPIAWYKGNAGGHRGAGSFITKETLRASLLPGLFHLSMIIAHMIAISLTKVAYMISVKRLSLLLGVYYGYLFFGERGLRERLPGTALMLAGVTLIVLAP